MAIAENMKVEGFVAKGFEPVRAAFLDNFKHRKELGAACCIYLGGAKVVDLWGGIRHKASGAPWEENTMVLVYSTTKGLAAMTLALAHSRGLLDYEKRVADDWPEFAQNGKANITVRQLLAHQAALFGFEQKVDKEVIADFDRLATVLSRERPAWEPGTQTAYHAISLGFYQGELLRRIDPKHRSLGQFFQDEIATPLNIDFYIRLPEEIPDKRLAVLERPGRFGMLFGLPFRLQVAAFNRKSVLYRSLVANPGTLIAHDEKRIYARNFEAPSGGGVGTARAIAKAYSAFATGGRELGLKPETLKLLEAPATPATKGGFYDACMLGDMQYSLGFMKSCEAFRLGGARSFGFPGAGGSLGFADPETGVGYAYVTNQMGTSLSGDPRDVALRSALSAVIRAR